MAGHSKWANIKHRKERSDAKKGKIFSRITKEIISAVKLGGPDPKANSRLRLALQKAKAANLPNENIERNIKKATQSDQNHYEEATYEIYAHGGVGLIIETMTDNKNRTASDIRIATNKKGGTIANNGAVAYNFDQRGVMRIAKNQAIEDEIFIAASEAGAIDFISSDTHFEILTEPTELYKVKETLDVQQFNIEETNLEMVPKTLVECNEKALQSNISLIEWLEELEDVDAVFHNMKLPTDE